MIKMLMWNIKRKIAKYINEHGIYNDEHISIVDKPKYKVKLQCIDNITSFTIHYLIKDNEGNLIWKYDKYLYKGKDKPEKIRSGKYPNRRKK